LLGRLVELTPVTAGEPVELDPVETAVGVETSVGGVEWLVCGRALE
jgi:hypothetical protein